MTGNNGTSVTYDGAGNRTTTGYTTTAGNRLGSDGTWSYAYDDEGRVTGKSKSGTSWAYAYDHAGQLTSASDGTTTVTYKYDAFGNRIERTEGTATTRYAFDGWDTAKPEAVGAENFDAWADLDAGNAITTRRVYGAGFDDATARVSAGGVVGWYATDRLGSVRKVLDNAGSVVASSDFDAFGKLTAGSLSDRYGFTGREWDSTLGVYDYRARVYAPDTGRFYGEDPIGFGAGDPNLHRYVGNNGVNWTDPSGLDADDLGSVWETVPPAPANPGVPIDAPPAGGPAAQAPPGLWRPPQRAEVQYPRPYEMRSEPWTPFGSYRLPDPRASDARRPEDAALEAREIVARMLAGGSSGGGPLGWTGGGSGGRSAEDARRAGDGTAATLAYFRTLDPKSERFHGRQVRPVVASAGWEVVRVASWGFEAGDWWWGQYFGPDLPGNTVQPPEFWPSLVPISGEAQAADYAYANGRYLSGNFHTAMAASDLCLVKAAVVGGLKALGRAVLRESAEAGAETLTRTAPRGVEVASTAGRPGVFVADVPPPEGFWKLRDLRREFQELSHGATYDEIVAGARRLGWEGDIAVFKGGSNISAAVLLEGPQGTLVVFERGFVHGGVSRPIRGNALIAHEIGHGSTLIPNTSNLARNQPRYWLREMQANAAAMMRPGLTAAEREMLVDDYIYSMKQFRAHGGMFPGEMP